MSKLSELSLENENIMKEALVKSGLDHVINVRFLGDDRQKKPHRIDKASIRDNFDTGIDIYVTINELIFDQLEDLQKILFAEESIAGLAFDYEKDKIIIKKGDFHKFSGFIDKHGYERCKILDESIKTLYNAKQEEASV